ncbi:MAG: carbon starvation CstA family protein, partial [Pirellulaceae bacterium]|nr:carbon starvation CstA family protein [Pirellulaceae bacterium]
MTWSILLLVYVFIASVLPVTWLLQPRDYINGHVLFVIMLFLAAGVLVSKPDIVAPALNLKPQGAPPIWPFLFVTIACGAISGFHCLVSSGTTSKQISCETDACPIGYGSMLMEGMLAVFVLVAVAAGIGLLADKAGHIGADRWGHHYSSWGAA